MTTTSGHHDGPTPSEAAGAKRLLRPYGEQAPTNPAGAR